MRVLYHHRTRAGDAQGIHICEMQRAFRLRGHEVEEVSLVPARATVSADGGTAPGRGAGRWADAAARRAPRLARELLELGYNALAYRRLARAIRRARPDLLYERHAAFTFAGVLAARRHGVPVVLEVNAPLADERDRHGGLTLRRAARACERFACGRADVTVVVSAALGSALAAGGVEPRRLVVLPNGVRRGFGAGDRERGRRRLGVAGGTPVVGVVAWFRAWHRLEDLLEAFDHPAIEGTGAVLALVGGGPSLERPPARLEALVAAGRAILPGQVQREELEDVLAALDVAVQPAVTPYACPMKLVEYLAAGCAVVAPGSANVRELVGDGGAALLCGRDEEPSPDDLREALLRLLGDGELRARLGAAARRRVSDRGLFWEENARHVEEEVAALAGGARTLPAPAADGFEVRPC